MNVEVGDAYLFPRNRVFSQIWSGIAMCWQQFNFLIEFLAFDRQRGLNAFKLLRV